MFVEDLVGERNNMVGETPWQRVLAPSSEILLINLAKQIGNLYKSNVCRRYNSVHIEGHVLGSKRAVLHVHFTSEFIQPFALDRRSQWPSGLRRGSAADRFLGLRDRITPEAWLAVCWKCSVFFSAKGRSPVQRSPTNYGVLVCVLKTSRMRRPWPALGCCSRRSWFRSSPSLFRSFILLEVIT